MIAAATAVGVLIAQQAIDVTLLILGLISSVLLIFVTPLASLSLLLVLAPLRALIATESSLQLPVDIGIFLLLVVLSTWGVHRIIRRQKLFEFEWSPVLLPVLVYASVMCLTVMNAVSLGAWLNEWLKWVLALVLICFALHMRNWVWMTRILIVAACANAIIGIYIFFGGSGALHLIIGERFFRAFGTFGQPNPFGGFMGLIAPLASMAFIGIGLKIIYQWRISHRIAFIDVISLFAYGFAFVLISAALFFSWSRGAWLGFGVSFVVMLSALPRYWWQSLIVFSIMLGLVVFVVLSGVLPPTVTSRIESATREIFILNDVRAVDITPENYAIVERLAHWQAALNMAQEHPWFGVGMGNYEIVYSDYRLLNWHQSLGHAHNYYLNVLAEAGIIGLSSYLAMLVSIIVLSWQARKHPDPLARSLAVGLLGTWTYLIVHSLTDNLYVNNLFLHVGVMLGILALIRHEAFIQKKVALD